MDSYPGGVQALRLTDIRRKPVPSPPEESPVQDRPPSITIARKPLPIHAVSLINKSSTGVAASSSSPAPGPENPLGPLRETGKEENVNFLPKSESPSPSNTGAHCLPAGSPSQYHHIPQSETGQLDMQSPNRQAPKTGSSSCWKPPGIRWPYLTFLSALHVVLLGLTLGCHNVEFKDTEDQSISIGERFVVSYLPYILCSILSQLIQGVDMDVKSIYPFISMSQADGAPAADSISLDYISNDPFTALYKSIRRRHWLVSASTATNIISSMILPLLAAVFFDYDTPVTSTGLYWDITIRPRRGAVGTTACFLSIHLVLSAWVAVRCHRADTGLSTSPYALKQLCILSRKPEFRRQCFGSASASEGPLPTWATSKSLHRNLSDSDIRVRLDRDEGGPYFAVIDINEGGDRSKRSRRQSDWTPEDFTPFVDSPSAWSRGRFWEWNPRQPPVFQKGPLLGYVVLLSPPLFTGIKAALEMSRTPYVVKRAFFTVFGICFKLYAEMLDRENRLTAPFVPVPAKGQDVPYPSEPIIPVARASLERDLFITHPLLSPIYFCHCGAMLLAKTALLPLVVEIFNVLWGQNTLFTNFGENEKREKRIQAVASILGTPGWIIGFFAGMAAMALAAANLSRYTPAGYPLPRRPDTIADRLSYIWASERLLSSALVGAGDAETSCALGLYEGRDGDLEMRFDVVEGCIRTFLPWFWFSSVESAILGIRSVPPAAPRIMNGNRELADRDDDTQPLTRA